MKKIPIEALVYFAGANAQAFEKDRSKPGNIWKQCTIAFRYDKDGKTTNRVAEPRRVFKTKLGEQMLLAWCPVGREWRTFSCDSITDIRTGGIGLRLLKQKAIKPEEGPQMTTTRVNLPQKTDVEIILRNIKVYAQLKQMAGIDTTNCQSYNEDAESRLIGIEKRLYDALDYAFKTGLDLGEVKAADANS